MSSVQPFTMLYIPENAADGIDVADSGVEVNVYVSAMGRNVAWRTTSKDIVKVTLNDYAKSYLYPNYTAHPIRADIQCLAFGSWSFSGNDAKGYHYIDDVNVFEWSFRAGITTYTSTKTKNEATDDAILKSTRNSKLQLGMSASNGSAGFCEGTITFYFNRYDFAAVADEGIASASVSSETGYDGDKITYSCTLEEGYVFEGWYDGRSFVSDELEYEHIVDGYDFELVARAYPDTHTETKEFKVFYGSNVIIDMTAPVPVVVNYNGARLLSMSEGTKILKCANKLMASDLTIGSKRLPCQRKLMRSDIAITFEDYVPEEPEEPDNPEEPDEPDVPKEPVVVTVNATASLSANGTAQVPGSISWNVPPLPDGATAWDSVVLSGSWTWTGKGGINYVRIGNQNTANGQNFNVNLPANQTSPLTIICYGGNKNATGNYFNWSNLVVTYTFLNQ